MLHLNDSNNASCGENGSLYSNTDNKRRLDPRRRYFPSDSYEKFLLEETNLHYVQPTTCAKCRQCGWNINRIPRTLIGILDDDKREQFGKISHSMMPYTRV